MNRGFLLVSLVVVSLFGIISASSDPVYLYDDNMTIRITGYSMYPTLNNGEIVNCGVSENYSAGDIVVYADIDNSLVCHRIVGSVFGKFLLKGDNNLLPDLKLVSLGDIVCKVN